MTHTAEGKSEGDARRVLWSRLVVEHRLKARDPFEAGDSGWEDKISECLLNDAPVSMEKIAELLELR